MSCFLSAFVDTPCDGPMDRAHLIPKQRIKRQFTGERKETIDEAVWHPSCWVYACRRHHGDFDNHVFRIPRAALPQGVELFAEAMGMVWSLDADFGVRT